MNDSGATHGSGSTAEEADGATMFDSLIACRRLVGRRCILRRARCRRTTARAQQVVVIVNGEPITALDIEQRSKLTQLSTHEDACRARRSSTS